MRDPKEKAKHLSMTLDVFIDETKEYFDRFWEQVQKYRTTQPGSEERDDAFVQLSVEAMAVQSKASIVTEIVDEIIDLDVD